MVLPLRAVEPKGQQSGQQNEYFKLKKKYFLLSTIFKIFGKIKRNLINNCDFLDFIISVTGCHCNYSPRAPKHLATPQGVSPLHI